MSTLGPQRCKRRRSVASDADTMSQKYNVPHAKKLTPREQSEVDRYRKLREMIHEGPYYTVIDIAASAAKKGSAARAQFDPFYGMPSYSERYQKKRRTLPTLSGRPYG